MHNDLAPIHEVPAERELTECVICELQDRKSRATVALKDVSLNVPRNCGINECCFSRVDIAKECGGHHVYTAGLCGNHAELYPMYPFIN